MSEEIEGLELAAKLVRLYTNPRARRLDRLDRYVCGTQYEGRPDFLEPEEDVGLMKRAPCIVYNAPAVAMGQHIDFGLGEGRFPKITTGLSEEDDTDDISGLTLEESGKFDTFLEKFLDAVRFRTACDEGWESAEGIGTAAAIMCARQGDLRLEPIDAKWATPTFGPDGCTVTKLVICYPFIETKQRADGKWEATCCLYRRELDDKMDVTFKPAKALEDGKMPAFQEDTRIVHEFGRCPVIWHRRKAGAKRCNDVDGHALHEHMLDECDTLNVSLSQRFRAMLIAGDPQIVESGVEPGEQVAGTVDARAGIVTNKETGAGYFGLTTRPKIQRRKGAGSVWRYRNENAKAYFIKLPAEVITSMLDHSRDLEEKISSTFGYTKLEIQGVRGAMSGKALGFLFARTTAFVDRERPDFWDGYMLPAISMLLGGAYTLASAGKTLFIRGLKKALPILKRFEHTLEGNSKIWRLPELTPKWGDYFEPTAEDEKYDVDLTVTAYTANLITLEVAVEKLRPVFGYRNSAAIVEALEQAKEEREAKALELMQKQPNGGANGDGNDGGGSGGSSGRGIGSSEPRGATAGSGSVRGGVGRSGDANA